MEESDLRRSRITRLLTSVIRRLFLYVLVPAGLFLLLAQPVGNFARRSDTAVFLIMLVAMFAVCVNWYVYRLLHGRNPTLPVTAHGLLCLAAVVLIAHDALPVASTLTSTLSVICGSLVLAYMLIISFWLAGLRNRPAHFFAILLRVLVGIVLAFLAYQIYRDIESRIVTRDTWITAGILIAFIVAFNTRKILAAFRRRALDRKADHIAVGKIYQIIGETHLDMDGDPVTLDYALIRYEVDGTQYETRADISRFTVRRFGKEVFIGHDIPVFYDPADPAGAIVKRIDRHFFDQDVKS